MILKMRDPREWRRWFAWRPVFVEMEDGGACLAWCMWIERRRCLEGPSPTGIWWRDYRFLADRQGCASGM